MSEPKSNEVKGLQFTCNDPELLRRDCAYWNSTMEHLIGFYATSNVRTEDGRELKALACARIAAHCYAMAEHFELATKVLMGGDLDPQSTHSVPDDLHAMIASAERIYSQGLKHHLAQECAAEKVQN